MTFQVNGFQGITMLRTNSIIYRGRPGIRDGRLSRIPYSDWGYRLNFDRLYKYIDSGWWGVGIGDTDSWHGAAIPGRAASSAGSRVEACNYPVDRV